MSLRSNHNGQRSGSVRFSRQGFSPIPGEQSSNMYPHGDATIDIPLQQISTQSQSPTGALRQDSTTPFASSTGANGLTKTTTAERRRTMGGRRIKRTNSKGQGKIGYDGEEDTLNRLGRFYDTVLNFSIVTRYLVYVTPLALCIAVPIIVGATAAKSAAIGGVRIVWFFAWIEIGE